MLDKDQYNQEEYNNYYQQETQGAEIKGSASPKESNGKGGIFAILALILLAIVGYFGYTQFMGSQTNDACATEDEIKIEGKQPIEVKQPEPSVQVEKETKHSELTIDISQLKDAVEAPEPSTQVKEATVQESVKSAVGTDAKMSPEEIAKVVQMVMSQMGTTSQSDTTASVNKESKKSQDNELMSALSGTDVDSVKEDSSLEQALLNQIDESKETTIQTSSATVNSYNKVNVEDNSGEDELSKLSGQISELISEKKTTEQTNSSTVDKTYTENLEKEVVTRENEMRIIIVKKGDTLGKIAKRAYGNVMEFKKIYQANPDILNRPDRIYIGQKLRIPK